MSYIEIINNSEKYIELLKQTDIVTIQQIDIKQSEDLIIIKDTLWGYYDVKFFIIDKKVINSNEIFENYRIICGDFFCGQGFLEKIYIKPTFCQFLWKYINFTKCQMCNLE
jgi:hypothetical protein